MAGHIFMPIVIQRREGKKKKRRETERQGQKSDKCHVRVLKESKSF